MDKTILDQDLGKVFEVSDEEGGTARLHPIATLVTGGKVYSLMGAIRTNAEGEAEGGLVLVRQSSLLNSEGTRYEVVADESEVEQVMSSVMGALLMRQQSGSAESEGAEPGTVLGPREFSICDDEDLLQ